MVDGRTEPLRKVESAVVVQHIIVDIAPMGLSTGFHLNLRFLSWNPIFVVSIQQNNIKIALIFA